MPACRGLDRKDRGVGILDEDAVLEVCVRRMDGCLCLAGVEILEVVARPRRRRVWWAFERHVRPVRNLMDRRAVLTVSLVVLLLADVAVCITRPQRGRLIFCEAVVFRAWSWRVCGDEPGDEAHHEQPGHEHGARVEGHGASDRLVWWSPGDEIDAVCQREPHHRSGDCVQWPKDDKDDRRLHRRAFVLFESPFLFLLQCEHLDE